MNIRQDATPVDRSHRELALELGLRTSGTRFWYGQHLFKHLPQYDAVFSRIVRELGDCQFIVIRHHGTARIADLFSNGSNGVCDA
jgi:hypothetical protein